MFSRNVLRSAFRHRKCTGNFNINCRSYTEEVNVVKSKLPNVNITEMLIHEYVWQNVIKWHDKTALVCLETGRSYTYGEIQKKSSALGRFLRQNLNLQRGDTVAVVLPNVPEYGIIILGSAEAGLKITTINPSYTASEISNQLRLSNAQLVFTNADLYANVQQAIKQTATNIKTAVVKQSQQDGIPSGSINFDEMCKGDSNTKLDQGTWEDTLFLPFSSGTTGLPKGVELTHKNAVSNSYQASEPSIRLQSDATGSTQEVIPLFLPMFHIYGLAHGFINMFSSGCKIVTIPKFGSQAFLKVLDHKPTIIFAVPPVVLMLLNNQKIMQHKNFSFIRHVASGAAPLGAADVERFKEKTKGKVDFLQIYGMTETSPLTIHQTAKVENGVKIGGCGFTVSNTECKIVSPDDPTNTGLGPNKSGELLIRGPQVMKGYYKNKKASKEVLIENGWLRTGDVAHYDEHEHFFVTDRIKELIKVKGFPVAPAELEEVLREHPSVSEAAVVGVPHPVHGEAPKGFVVLKSDASTKPEELQKYLASKVASYKQLTGGVVILDSIPKTASGKILRKELKNI